MAVAPAVSAVARLECVEHRYGRTIALDKVDLDIPAGRLVGLIGPDGVGKSTLLSLISGARRVQSGRVTVLGGDIADPRHRAAACGRIAFMPQGLGRNLYPTLSVAENIDFFGRLFGHGPAARHQRAQALLAATGLGPFAERPAGKLAGGMKQKLGLCCALIHDPDLLILDEPTTGVDPLSRRQFWALIDRLRAQRAGLSIVVATAYMEEATAFDWLIALDEGRILAAGTAAEFQARTGTASLEDAFIALLPPGRRGRDGRLVIPPWRDDGSPPVIEARDLSCRFGDFTAVDRVNFSIRRGEIFGFLGSNGCGKTTTMKMLTGLLPASDGQAFLFGSAVDGTDIERRRRVGYMSQSFSLYAELTVRQNLILHARLFQLPAADAAARTAELLARFGLEAVADDLPERLPLGQRQRLSLAVAVIHRPDMLILDEPTSGVDPVARDDFWRLLAELSRDDGVTIFISTHFMNEAERCDRLSLMHAGRVLAQGAPAEIRQAQGTETLEAAFIGLLERAAGEPAGGRAPDAIVVEERQTDGPGFSLRRLWAYAFRETLELRRDPVRLAFALLGPLILMIAFGFGISFDVENLSYAVLDRDQTPASRSYLENFAGSRYFEAQPPLADDADLDARLRDGSLRLAIEIPPGFGRDLTRGRGPEVGVWLDGAMPFRAETARGYVRGVHSLYVGQLAELSPAPRPADPAFGLETRFRYNQDFRSVYAIVPGVLMLLLIMIPAMMTAVGVVREKEMGSIINLYVTPVRGSEFLLGKQLPYIGVALINLACLVLLAVLVFGVPLKGSPTALAAGGLLYVVGATGIGIAMSAFMSTQIAAIFGTAIAIVIPAVNFSGLLFPVSSLTGSGAVMATVFPSAYFQRISVGAFTKALGWPDIPVDLLALALFAIVILMAGRAVLRTQEA